MGETPMEGLAEWLRADALDANPRNAAKLNRWASEVEAARASLPAPTEDEWLKEAEKLAMDFAHCYAFVGDDTMPRRKDALLAHLRTRPAEPTHSVDVLRQEKTHDEPRQCVLGEVWMAFGRMDDGRLIALPEYAAASARAVGEKVIESARREGFKGSLRERMEALGWIVRRVVLADVVMGEEAKDAQRYRWLRNSPYEDGAAAGYRRADTIYLRHLHGADLDAAIDKELSKEKP